MTPKQKYHEYQLEEGLEFQDLVNEYMIKTHNLPIIYYTSYKRQWNGESFNGIEIKYDKRSVTSNNLFILSKVKNKLGKWQPSGIYKNDNTTWFIIGNLKEAWMISKHMLLQLVPYLTEVETNTGESMGYLLPKEKANKIRCIKLTFNNNNGIL